MIRVCPSCGKSNRVPSTKLDKTARCGECKAALPPDSKPVTVDGAASFDELIAGSPLPVLVDFWADWCGPCRIVAPELEQLARTRAGRLVVAKVDTDGVPDVAARFDIRSIPTLILFRNGREEKRQAGAMRAAEIERAFGLI